MRQAGDRGSCWIGWKSIGRALTAVSAVRELKRGDPGHYLGWHLHSTKWVSRLFLEETFPSCCSTSRLQADQREGGPSAAEHGYMGFSGLSANEGCYWGWEMSDRECRGVGAELLMIPWGTKQILTSTLLNSHLSPVLTAGLLFTLCVITTHMAIDTQSPHSPQEALIRTDPVLFLYVSWVCRIRRRTGR